VYARTKDIGPALGKADEVARNLVVGSLGRLPDLGQHRVALLLIPWVDEAHAQVLRHLRGGAQPMNQQHSSQSSTSPNYTNHHCH
jgi:hypothetical protein